MNECEHNCSDTPGSFKCQCSKGYNLRGDRVSCADLDECSIMENNCEQNCQNTPGSYECLCEAGYKLDDDGYSCSDINECLEEHDCREALDKTICNNTIGGYECVCIDGYQMSTDNQQCETIPIEPNEQCSQSGLLLTCPPVDESDKTVTDEDAVWPRTSEECSVEWRKCHGNVIGDMTRECLAGGVWGKIDDTGCITHNTRELYDELQNVTNLDDATDVMSKMEHVVTPGNINEAGDLILLTEIFGQIIGLDILNAMNESVKNKLAYIQKTVNVASTFLDENNEGLWSKINQFRGPTRGAGMIILHFDHFASRVAKFMTSESLKKVEIKSPNIDFRADVFDSDTIQSMRFPPLNRNDTSLPSNSSFEDVNRENDTFIFIPASTIQAAVEKSPDNAVTIVSALFRNLSRILSTEMTKASKYREWIKSVTATQYSTAVNSIVISTTLYPNRLKDTLPEPVVMKFLHLEEGWDEKCSFIVYGEDDGLWDSDGCELVIHDGEIGATVCECTHTTSFGLVMKLGPAPVFFLLEGLGITTIIGYGMTLLLLLGALIAILFSRLRMDQYFVLVNIIIAEVLTTAVLLTASQQVSDTTWCTATAIATHCLFLCCFFWSMIKCLQVYKRVRHCQYESCRRTRVWCLIGGWIVPMVVVFASVMTEYGVYKTNTGCWMLNDGLVSAITQYFPAACTQVVSIGLCGYICCKLDPDRSLSVKYDQERTLLDARCTVIYIVLLTPTWFLGFVTNSDSDDMVMLRYCYVILCFSKASVLLLGFICINPEVLQGIRYSNSRDENSRIAWTDHLEFEKSRLEMAKASEEDIIQRQNVKEATARNRSKMIQCLFDQATQTQASGTSRMKYAETTM
ncbi:adhesion G protein-coupled receptor L3-like [Glandiceps talaboti]